MNIFKRKNLMAKIISILFALTIWIYVMSEINPRITRDEQNIPVEFVNAEEMRQNGLVVKGDTDYTIRVRITGRRDEVYRIARGQIKATADLLGYRAGVNNIPVEITIPGEVEVDYNPKFIRVDLEEIVSKQKPVNVTVEGTPRSGYVLGSVAYEPRVVWVEGPESLVNSVEVAESSVKLSEEFQNVHSQFPLRPLNSRGEEVQGVNISPAHVDITLPIDQLKTVEVTSVVETTAAEGYEISNISINPNRITIRGQQEIIDAIETIETERITINNITENITRTVALRLPEGVAAVDPTEVSMTVSVEEIKEVVIQIPREQINFTNLREGLTLDTSDVPEILQVKILGNETLAQSINREDINIIVDMEGLDENEYTIEPIVELPFLIQRRARRVELVPNTVNIKVISQND
ncbi:hypothetical protein CACET_c34980 [Clostridium aceticum]|uniref:Uncharacterized protein n=1 Tax=Clostridium aceticum TaxID=84022 RepID=A0A0D8I613_9CLOT|nr:CdaR family protein [Clostridium aceticum]AKL96941.1 hypothetical protein CACET_c34980 [Clostridium aceticum]KJF25489.1 hypothetical protein TZ02_18330 [Clostridium aceticum]